MKHYLIRTETARLRGDMSFLLRGYKIGIEAAGCNNESLTIRDDAEGIALTFNDERLVGVLNIEISNYGLTLEKVKNHVSWTVVPGEKVQILDDENRMMEELTKPDDMGEEEFQDLIAFRIEELNKP